MKNIVLTLSVILMVLGCGQKTKNNTDKSSKPIVTVTIHPQKFFVEQIAGDYCNVNVMMAPGASEHEYEPTPKQVRELSKSDIYFFIGHLGFEKSWMKRMAQSAPNVEFVSCSKRIDLLNSVCKHDHENHDDHKLDGTDPHIWTSPENVKTISRTICSTLISKYPEKKVEFENNLSVFLSKIDSLDLYIRNEISDLPCKSFMLYHPSLGYFAETYFLTQHSIEYEGKTPSAAHIKKMVDLARNEGISTIFVQAQFETAKAEVIAKEIGARVVVIDPLNENWLEEMYLLANKMKAALSTSKPITVSE